MFSEQLLKNFLIYILEKTYACFSLLIKFSVVSLTSTCILGKKPDLTQGDGKGIEKYTSSLHP